MPYPTPQTTIAPIEETFQEVVTTEAILIALELALFDHLASEAMPVKALADLLGVKAKPLAAMLDVLAHKGLLEKTGERYANTVLASEYLVSSAPLYHGKALSLQHHFNERIRGNLFDMLKGDSSQREETDNQWGQADIMIGTLQHALNGQIQGATQYLAGLEGFSDFREMADIGGNHGQYSMELLDQNPQLKSTLYDLPSVTEAAAKRCRDMGYGQRIICKPFDIRNDTLPANTYDFIFISHLLYGCSDQLDKVFVNVHNALKPGGYMASHHFAPEGGASVQYKANVQFITRLMGYDMHFIPKSMLEPAMNKAGFTDMQQTFTGVDNQTLLLVGRKQ